MKIQLNAAARLQSMVIASEIHWWNNLPLEDLEAMLKDSLESRPPTTSNEGIKKWKAANKAQIQALQARIKELKAEKK